MKHLGDITKIKGAAAPPANVIIGGSPCQDLSVAGKRAGLAGERSGLFMEQIRIIKEMRKASERSGANDIKPRYMVWENVPGAFSSNKGQDFKAVLEETIGVVEKENKPDIPVPDGGWHYSGCIVGDGFSVAWRVFDAQFWGVPQRRRRIALIADFGGFTAPEILFERKGVFGDSPPGGTSWKDFARVINEHFTDTDRTRIHKIACGFNGHKSSTGSIQYKEERAPTIERNMPPNIVCGFPLGFRPENTRTYDETGTERISTTYCLQGNGIDRADTAGCNGKGWREDKSYTLNTVDRPAVYDARGNGDGETVPTITGGHENRITDYTGILCNCAGFKANMGGKAHGIGYEKQKSPTLSAQNNDASVVIHSTVRRLTPLECERLQGFPDGWTDIGAEYVDTGGKKRKVSDSARYKALGNSIALPPWAWLLERLSFYCGDDRTMASLFDGIGGFPLIWETLNGEGTCLWVSEIEEFPIAVTKYHFNHH